MKQYKINKQIYLLRDFTFGEQEKVLQIRTEIIADESQADESIEIKSVITNDRLVEILNFILETETGEPAVITTADLAKTGMLTLSELILDFVTYELQYALEKKRYFENSTKELSPLMKRLNRFKK